MKVLYDTILKATYIGRPNRFVVTLDLNGERVLAQTFTNCIGFYT